MTVCKSNHFATYLDKPKLEKTVSSIETHILPFPFSKDKVQKNRNAVFVNRNAERKNHNAVSFQPNGVWLRAYRIIPFRNERCVDFSEVSLSAMNRFVSRMFQNGLRFHVLDVI